MADKKLNELSTATDLSYVYSENASGAQQKISKEDLASVLAVITGIGNLKTKLSNSRNYLLGDSEVGTFGILFACSASNNSYCIASYKWTKGSDGVFSKLAGDLTLSRINEYGSVVVEGADIFAVIYFNIDDVTIP